MSMGVGWGLYYGVLRHHWEAHWLLRAHREPGSANGYYHIRMPAFIIITTVSGMLHWRWLVIRGELTVIITGRPPGLNSSRTWNNSQFTIITRIWRAWR